MRLKKKNIMEMVNGNQNLPDSNKISDVTNKVKELSAEVDKVNTQFKDMPFISKVDENIGGFDPNYGSAEDLEYLASRKQQMIDAYAEWLNSPEGEEYIKKMDAENQNMDQSNDEPLPFAEGVKHKKKVIKTIKVKDIK